MIYFIRAGETESLKIGYTEDKKTLKLRMHTLQTGNPYELILEGLIDGGYSEENILHNFFKDNRLNGEWFKMPEKVCIYEMKRIIIKEKYRIRKALINENKPKKRFKKREETRLKNEKIVLKSLNELLDTSEFISNKSVSEMTGLHINTVKKYIAVHEDEISKHNKSIYKTDNYNEYLHYICLKQIKNAIKEIVEQGEKPTYTKIFKATGIHRNTVSRTCKKHNLLQLFQITI